ncbi:hypothetical protein [Gemmobacter sp.]|uniref:hypothetical protein n=1 Tax=Gemmobacter sp. TaxID=1898957 RepID=UPI002AFFF2C7|nr:hypothetical protein [Gemmobacter sp.]
MKFVLSKTNRYWWPVTVRLPDPDQPGKMLEQTLKILFEPKDQDDALAEQTRIAAIKDPRAQVLAEREALADVCKGWDDIVDDDKTAIPFTPENLMAALQKAWFRAAVYRAYGESLSGEEARLGN